MSLSDVKVKQGRIEKESSEVLVLPLLEGTSSFQGDAGLVDRALDGALRGFLF